MTTRIETNGARHARHVVLVDRLAGGLDRKGHTEVVNRWPDANNAKNLRRAVAGEVSLHVAENDSRVGLARGSRRHGLGKVDRHSQCEDRTNRSDAHACCHHLKLDTTLQSLAGSLLLLFRQASCW